MSCSSVPARDGVGFLISLSLCCCVDVCEAQNGRNPLTVPAAGLYPPVTGLPREVSYSPLASAENRGDSLRRVLVCPAIFTLSRALRAEKREVTHLSRSRMAMACVLAGSDLRLQCSRAVVGGKGCFYLLGREHSAYSAVTSLPAFDQCSILATP